MLWRELEEDRDNVVGGGEGIFRKGAPLEGVP